MWEKGAELPVSVLSPNGPGTTCPSSVRFGSFRTWRRTGFSPSTSGHSCATNSPKMRPTVVCAPDYLPFWHTPASLPEPPVDERIRLLGFVADVHPLYVEANLVLVPTTVLAGKNIKVLVAVAMRRAVVSASSGCAGLGLTHGHNPWIADTPEAFASSVAAIITDAHVARRWPKRPVSTPYVISTGEL